MHLKSKYLFHSFLSASSLVSYSDIQRLAQQQSQIQQMMHTSQSAIPSTASPSRPPPPSQTNPMDPQPFYISQPDPPPQRRTWGQPQPISFAHQGPGGGVEWPPQQPPRRAQWGAPQVRFGFLRISHLNSNLLRNAYSF